jgi:hypothetical protein
VEKSLGYDPAISGEAGFMGSANIQRLDADHTSSGRAIWMALIVVAGAGMSVVFACATPFAALATLAASKTERRDTALAVGLVWLLNQIIGYAFLHYPRGWDSFAWGAAIGAGAGMGLVAAIALAPTRKGPLAVSLPFVGAFTAYEFTLYLASFILPTEPYAFGLPVVREIFVVNAVSLIGLMFAHWLATVAGLLPDPDQRDASFNPALSVR